MLIGMVKTERIKMKNTMLFDDSIEETLLSQGVREHCCVILDGGEEAFAKRKSKYNI